MNAVILKVKVAREGSTGISFVLDREGHGDDVVEMHVAFLNAVLTGAVAGLRALRGSPDDCEKGDSGKT